MLCDHASLMWLLNNVIYPHMIWVLDPVWCVPLGVGLVGISWLKKWLWQLMARCYVTLKYLSHLAFLWCQNCFDFDPVLAWFWCSHVMGCLLGHYEISPPGNVLCAQKGRDHSGHGLSQWEDVLPCNAYSHSLNPYLDWSLKDTKHKCVNY